MKITFTFLMFFLTVSLIKAQTSNPEPAVYSRIVVANVNDVTSAVSLSEAKKTALFIFFQKQETMFDTARKGQYTAQQTGALTAKLKAEFTAILSPQELKTYSEKRKGAYYAVPDSTTRTQRPANPR